MNYRRSDGTRLWVYDVKQDGDAQTFHGDMVRHQDGLFVAADPTNGLVYHFEAASGELRWYWDSVAGVSSDLFVHDDRLVVVTLFNELTALDVATGYELWRSEPVDASGLSPVTPTPVAIEDDLLFGRADGRLSLHTAESGTTIWTRDLGAGISTDLLRLEESVYLGLDDGRFLRVDPATGETEGYVALDFFPSYRWFATEPGVVVGMTGVDGSERHLIGIDPVSMEILWNLESPDERGWTIAQPGLGWESVLVGNREPALYAVDVSTGHIRWRAGLDHPPRTVKVVEDDLYIGSFDGMLSAYRVTNRPGSH